MVRLVIEGSNSFLSVALLRENEVLALREFDCKRNLSEVILLEINKALEDAGLKKTDISEIVAAKGPGSYTALRIVLTLAKTLAYSLKVSLKTISTLRLQSYYEESQNKFVVPLIDGRRGNVFAAIYEDGKEVFEEGYYELTELIDFLNTKSKEVIFIGPDLDIYDFSKAEFEYKLAERNNSAKSLIYLNEYVENTTYLDLKPAYLRITEAERNLIDDKNR